MGDRTAGLIEKYEVARVDGKPISRGCIVLEWKDPNAREGIRAFSEAVRADGYDALADDLDEKLAPWGAIGNKELAGHKVFVFERANTPWIEMVNDDQPTVRMTLQLTPDEARGIARALNDAAEATDEPLLLLEGSRGDDLPWMIVRGSPSDGTPVAAFLSSDDAVAFRDRLQERSGRL